MEWIWNIRFLWCVILLKCWVLFVSGEPGELNIPSFGEKFIGVEEGGVLELHGKDKLSWTKLSQHAPRYQEEVTEIYNHRVYLKYVS